MIEPGGVKATREVVCHRGSVVVLPRLDDGRVLLVRQFRYAAGKSLWELVAGGIELGETPAAAARRELLEETGYRARTLRPLFHFYASPGFLSERMFLFEARGLILNDLEDLIPELIHDALRIFLSNPLDETAAEIAHQPVQ